MMGMPAFMKTANWRVKFMTSWRGTIFLVISNLRMLFLALTSKGWSPRSIKAKCAAPVDAAASVPETFLPASSSAL